MCARCLELSRRSLLIGGGVAAAALSTGAAQARIRPADMVPLIGPGFRPTDRDEQGLWKEMERAEEEIAGSTGRSAKTRSSSAARAVTTMRCSSMPRTR